MSVHDEWDRQRDREAEGQRAGREPIRIEKSLFADAPFTIGSVPLEAVPLLLAVAKAGAFLSLRVNELATSYPNNDDSWEHRGASQAMFDVFRVVEALDRAHPGWREWA